MKTMRDRSAAFLPELLVVGFTETEAKRLIADYGADWSISGAIDADLKVVYSMTSPNGLEKLDCKEDDLLPHIAGMWFLKYKQWPDIDKELAEFGLNRQQQEKVANLLFRYTRAACHMAVDHLDDIVEKKLATRIPQGLPQMLVDMESSMKRMSEVSNSLSAYLPALENAAPVHLYLGNLLKNPQVADMVSRAGFKRAEQAQHQPPKQQALASPAKPLAHEEQLISRAPEKLRKIQHGPLTYSR